MQVISSLYQIITCTVFRSTTSNSRFVSRCFYGYLPEHCGIRLCDVKLCSTLSVFLEISKTNQLREDSWVPISRGDRKMGAVKVLGRYLLAAEMSLEEDLSLPLTLI